MKNYLIILFITLVVFAGKLSAQCPVVGPAIPDICQGATTIALGATLGDATSAIWNDGPAGGSFSDNDGSTPGLATYTASASSGSPVTLTLSITGGACDGTTLTKDVIVNPSTSIDSQSTATQTECIGGTFTAISVTASGTGPLSYQWYSNTTASTSGGNTVGTDNASYTPSAASAGTLYYYCVVTGTCGTATSAVSGAFVVNPATSIDSQSTATQTECIGGTFTAISVTASGTGPLSYQWYSNTTASTSGGTMVGTDNASYTPSAASAGTLYYYCVVTGTCGTATSAVSEAFVVDPASVGGTAAASDQTICYGLTPADILLTGIVGSVQNWQYDENTGFSSPGTISIASTTLPGTSVGSLTNTTYFRAVVKSGVCPAVASTEAKVTVRGDLTADITPPGPLTICYNSSPGSYTATGTGGSASYSYLWYKDGLSIGVTTQSYDPGLLTASTTIYCAITDPACGTLNTPDVDITVLPQVTLTGISYGGPVCAGNSGIITLSGLLSGSTSDISYTIDGVPHTASGVSESSPSFSTVPLTAANNGKVLRVTGITNTTTTPNCTRTFFYEVTLIVNAIPVPTISGSAAACIGSSSNVYITEAGKDGYIWTVSPGGTIDSGDGTNSISVSWNTDGPKIVTVTYSVNGCSALSPATFNVNVSPLPVPTVTGPVNSCLNSSGNVYNTEADMNTYIWSVPTGGSFTGTGNTIVVTWTSPGSHTVSVSYKNASGCTGSGTPYDVNVYGAVSASISGGASPICYNTNPGNLTASGSGGTGSYTYLWYKNGLSTGVTDAVYDPGNLTSTSLFYCAVTSGSCGTANTSVTTITVHDDFTASISGGTTPICYNTSPGTLTATASGGSGSYNYLWYKDGVPTTTTIPVYNPGDLTATADFYCAVTDASCGTINTATTTITVFGELTAGISGGTSPLCYNTSPGTFTASASGGTGTYSYLWFKNGVSTSITSNTYNPGPLTTSTDFYCQISSGTCLPVNTSIISTTVHDELTASLSGGLTPILYNTSPGIITATGTGGTLSYTYLWYKNGISTSVTTDTYDPGNLLQTSEYYCSISSGGCGTANSSTKTISVNALPEARDVIVIGDRRSGLTLNSSYFYTDTENDPEGTSLYQWYTGTSSTGTGSVPISGEVSRTYKVKDIDIGKYIGFSVTPIASTGSSPGNISTSISWKGPIINDPPVATISPVTGSLNVSGVLTGHYTYSDTEGDIEDGSVYQWYSASTSAGTYTAISGESSISHVITDNEQGRYFKFRVVPKAVSGNLTGSLSESPAYGPANTEPYALNVNISGIAALDSTLTATYEYHDIDLDTEGTSIYRWLRNGSQAIPGATGLTYVLTSDDEGYKISFELTPVSATGFPSSGVPVQSAETSSVIDLNPDLPVASQVCIQGVRAKDEVLTGNYKYTFPSRPEGSSTFRWLRNGVPVIGATSRQYIITQGDIDSDEEITFEVTPVSSNEPPKAGAPVASNPLARIMLAADSYSLADPDVPLVANVGGGIFSGPGVSNGFFSPVDAGSVTSPHIVSYLLSIVNSSTTCSQQATDTIVVVPISAYFESFRDIYCHDGGEDTITVANVPATATGLTFTLTNPSGFVRLLDPKTIVIDPGKMRPGNKEDTLFFSFIEGGSVFPISKAFVIDSVGTNLAMLNIEAAYCDGSPKRYITIEGTYPGGGTAIWTGTLMTDPTPTSSFLDPLLGSAGTTYPVSYQYISPYGCKSVVINKNVTINPLPNSSFILDPTYNIDGGEKNLVSTVTIGNFIGPGVLGTKFYPDIAGQGTHEIKYYVTDANSCSSNTAHTTTVRKVQGSYENLPSIICYRDTTYNISVSGLPSGITILDFINTRNSLVHVSGTTTATYNLKEAGAGYDTVRFSYTWDGVDYMLTKSVFIDSIGNIAITGLKDNYCDYETLATLRVLVENSTGSGNFDFSGPDSSFTNYGNLADFYPFKTPSSATPYFVSYTHVSTVNGSGCRKTVEVPVIVNKSPDVSILKTRTTINSEEPPVLLEGIPAEGSFSGKGIYKSGDSYYFDPAKTGLGDIGILLSYIDSKGCYAEARDTLTVAIATGFIEGVNTGGQYCYDGVQDTLNFVSNIPYSSGSFLGAGIINISADQAVFYPDLAGKGDHSIRYKYLDLAGTPYEVYSHINVDSIGMVNIVNLDPGAVFCNNDPGFKLGGSIQGGVFEGPVDGENFNPSKAVGDTSVVFTYISSSTGCSSSVVVPIVINPAPVLSFLPADYCIETGVDSTKFINNTISSDDVSSWLWDFSDADGPKFSNVKYPGILYSSGGLKKVVLEAKTVKGCSSVKELTFDLGFRPQADFYWIHECYNQSDSLEVFDNSTSTSQIISQSWNFFDGAPITNDSTWAIYPKASTGYVEVQYIVRTKYENCADTVTKQIFIRPTIDLKADDYFEDFESGNGGWVKGEDSDLSWSFGTPDRPVINNAASGDSAWYTSYDLMKKIKISSAIESPCFNFSEIERPMIGLKISTKFDRDRDGAVLQYRSGDATNWSPIGTLGDGINWFNSPLISGNPGGYQIGWTTIDPLNTGWKESRHSLDFLKGSRDVKFRIAYGSDGTTVNTDGIAFDDIWIGERKRDVLIEHFTNISDINSSEANDLVNEIASNREKDVINIQYHTNFPGNDPYYNENPGGAGARVLYYGLIKTPYTFVDGGTRKDYANSYDYQLADIDSNDVSRRSLITPKFSIKFNTEVSGGVVTIKDGQIKALQDVSSDNLTLYLALTEKENSDYTGAAGETSFFNVFRKFIPDAGGINLKQAWLSGETVDFSDLSWVVENVKSSSDIEIVAFIQNNLSKEIYQAASMLQKEITVGVEKLLNGSENGFAIYPNPAVNKFTIDFREPLTSEADIKVYDMRGVVIATFRAGPGESVFTVEDAELKSGIYLVRVSVAGVGMGFRKLIISGN